MEKKIEKKRIEINYVKANSKSTAKALNGMIDTNTVTLQSIIDELKLSLIYRVSRAGHAHGISNWKKPIQN